MTRRFKAPSIEATKKFYENLNSGAARRGLWGREARFDPSKKSFTVNIDRHFVASAEPFLAATDDVLDFGCGPGIFSIRLAGLCKSVTGVDISQSFVTSAKAAVAALQLKNVSVFESGGESLEFSDATFDKIVMVDVIHHLENIEDVIAEVHRVLKDDGKLLIFEPNKWNPVLTAMCLLDTNEWGLLSLGTKKSYSNVLQKKFKIEYFKFCGLLIGPESKLAFFIADFLLSPKVEKFLGFLSPKLFIVASKL